VDVTDGGEVVAQVRPGRSLDESTLRTIIDATRLVAARERLAAEAEAERRAVDSARSRLARTAERRRDAMTESLSTRVLPPLSAARALLTASAAGVAANSAADAVSGAIDELADAIKVIPESRFAGERLDDALRDLASRLGPHLTVDAAELDLDPVSAAALYFAASESLTNAVKHSGAHRVEVRLARAGDGVRLTVEDDGIGGADARGRGLQGLADRAAQLGGGVQVHSEAGKGTTVAVTIPAFVSRSAAKG
jgi:signal transduction histidine kinase